jgi:hypothetical protein
MLNRKTEIISSKVRTEKGCFIQYSTGILSQRNKARDRNKMNSNEEERSQVIPICR